MSHACPWFCTAFIQVATANLIVAQYVVRDMEEANVKCEHRTPCSTEGCDQTDLHIMEGAVAFYFGSMEGAKGLGSGVLQYDLADKMCIDFRTCGPNGDKTSGTSRANHEILKEFYQMQSYFQNHECVHARHNEDRVKSLMLVPLIQATLKQAYILQKQSGASMDEEAKGAAYAATLLPIVAKCDPADGLILWENMKPSSGHNTDFHAVKEALERNYKCMRVSCEEVGGYYWGGPYHSFYAGAEPCGGKPPGTGTIVGTTLGAFFAVLIAYGGFKLYRKRKSGSKARRNVQLSARPGGEAA